MQISALSPGTAAEGVYAVRSKERRMSRRGEPYLLMTLSDATGSIRALCFDQADFFGEQFAEGDRIRVTGQVIATDGDPTVRVRHIRRADDEATPESLLPRSHRDPDELFGFVLHLADEVADAGLRRLLGALTGDQALVERWCRVPCTQTGHHAYQGGLIEHTVGVATLCQTLCQWHPRLNSDLLLAAALVHDIGLTATFHLGATFELTDEGRLLGHLALGHEIVSRAATECKLTAETRLALLHIVAWHHGPPADQDAAAASAEALALWRANDLEADVKCRLERR